MKRDARPCMPCAPALSSGSPVATPGGFVIRHRQEADPCGHDLGPCLRGATHEDSGVDFVNGARQGPQHRYRLTGIRRLSHDAAPADHRVSAEDERP